mmetsp:Transcript_17777/g.51732  ORF Transcript_17777/g.51732 Transcript_17777/m.51732 type:complete len:201 (+) Transcript_17777:350-952(+)
MQKIAEGYNVTFKRPAAKRDARKVDDMGKQWIPRWMRKKGQGTGTTTGVALAGDDNPEKKWDEKAAMLWKECAISNSHHCTAGNSAPSGEAVQRKAGRHYPYHGNTPLRGRAADPGSADGPASAKRRATGTHARPPALMRIQATGVAGVDESPAVDCSVPDADPGGTLPRRETMLMRQLKAAKATTSREKMRATVDSSST